MTFFSHSKINENGQVYGSKELIVHINGVLEKTLEHYSQNLGFDISEDELRGLLKVIVQFHDLGKYTSYFQNYLLDKKPIDGLLKQHARIGGFVAYNKLKGRNEKQALIALYLIFLHHSQLIDIQNLSGKLNDNLQQIITYQKKDLQKALLQIQKDLMIEEVASLINYPEEKSIRRALKIWAKREQNIRDYFLINYLFSLLIESDKLDASDTKPYLLKEIESSSVDERFGKPLFESHTIDSMALGRLSNNQLRNYCRSQVISNLNHPKILDQHIFTLTAPTGIGKTMTALDFALKLKEKVRKELNIQSRIIYALPFINIIEQSIKEYKETLPESTEILAHYQYADIFGDDKDSSNEDGAESNYYQKLMALDTWQADIVITSFVQFFETLIGNRNKLLKKFNHYANAIIILDEVQTLRLDQMPLIGAALFYLAKFLKSRIILMTATKPKIFELAQQQILSEEGEKVVPMELLKCHKDVFATFHRTKMVPLLTQEFDKTNLSQDFVSKAFSVKWQPNKSCIIVCNTVNRSIEVYEGIKTYLEQEGLENPIRYLSTNIIPVQRKERIAKIKNEIKSGANPILIATQVVEAGVDLDFDMGFRDIGPIDSIIQVAGRINRNNNLDKAYSPLYIVDFGDAQKIYGRITCDQATSALQKQPEFLEEEYLSLIALYFDIISDKKSFSRFNKVFESMKMLKYDSEDMENDRPISCFKIIDEAQTAQAVFVELGEKEKVLKEKYLAKIKNEIAKEEWDREFKHDFQQRIISIPDYLTNDLSPINEFEGNLKIVPLEVIDQKYDLNTGFIRDNKEVILML
jgi:CRISPR-associated endonuclease/helicase Cas3